MELKFNRAGYQVRHALWRDRGFPSVFSRVHVQAGQRSTFDDWRFSRTSTPLPAGNAEMLADCPSVGVAFRFVAHWTFQRPTRNGIQRLSRNRPPAIAD